MRRFSLIAGTLVGIVLLVAVARIGWRLQLRAQLRAEVARDARRTWPRPAFAEQHPGTFAELARPGLKRIEEGVHMPPDSCRALWEQGSGTLDPECRNWLEAHWPAAEIVLAATHAQLGSWDIRTLHDQDEATRGIIRASQVAALHMLLDEERHDSQAAANTCLEALALGRDAAVTGTVLGTNIAAVVVRNVFPTCTAILEDAPDKSALAHAVRSIEEGLPPSSRMFHTEALVQAASLDSQLKQPWNPSAWLTVDALLEGMARYEAVGHIAEEPEPERSRDIGRNEIIRAWSPNPYVREGTSPLRFLRREEEMRSQLGLLRQLVEK